jgi:hypothetical protein
MGGLVARFGVSIGLRARRGESGGRAAALQKSSAEKCLGVELVGCTRVEGAAHPFRGRKGRPPKRASVLGVVELVAAVVGLGLRHGERQSGVWGRRTPRRALI